MRAQAALVILVMLLLAYSPPAAHASTEPASFGPCCEYAFIVSNRQPMPGERVDIVGAVTGQFGGGEENVSIQYQDATGTSINTSTELSGAFYLNRTFSAGSSGPIQFTITFVDAAAAWSGRVTDSFSPPSGNVIPALYSSLFGGRSDAYINIQSIGRPGVIYIGGGFEEPILHGVSSIDNGTKDFLDKLAGNGFNVIAPIGWFVSDTPTFPYVMAAMLKYGFQMTQVYLIGWSAGAAIAAWSLTRDMNQIFNLGIIMDGELTGAANQTQTNPQVFNTATAAGAVKVPHLLIWGISETGQTGTGSAMEWASHAQFGFARLDTFNYAHQWIGSDAEPEVWMDIVAFFGSGSVGTSTKVETGNVTFRVLSNSQLNLGYDTYDPLRKAFYFQTMGQDDAPGSINLVIPATSIGGQPVVLIDGKTANSISTTDNRSDYIYVTYNQSYHTIVVGGQNTVPEFSSELSIWGITLVLTIVSISAFSNPMRRRSRKTGICSKIF